MKAELLRRARRVLGSACLSAALVLGGCATNRAALRAAAAERAAPTVDPRLKALTPEAREAAMRLTSTLPRDSEAMAMVDAVLDGYWLGPTDGWFRMSRAQSLYGWEYAAGRYDANRDGAVSPDEYPRPIREFARLDRTLDRALTEEDFNWENDSLAPSAGYAFFSMADGDANGKVTPRELSQFLGSLDSDRRGFLALDDLRYLIPPIPPSRPADEPVSQRPPRTGPSAGGPDTSMLVMSIYNQEVGSLLPGPAVGDTAPDFTLRSLNGSPVTLSDYLGGEKPVVLIFGNFTCGPFRSQAGNIEKLYERYKDRANFFLVYVREAHPADGWSMAVNSAVGIYLPQPTTDDERLAVAQTCQRYLDIDMPFLVDTIDDKVGTVYSGMPNRLYLIDPLGRVVFKNARGPFGFHPQQLEQALILQLNQGKDRRVTQPPLAVNP